MSDWVSPDGKILKTVAKQGEWGLKPYDLSECKVKITDCPLEFKNFKTVIIGDNDGTLGRFLDHCLVTMSTGEVAVFNIPSENVSFTLELLSFNFKGYIYEWSTKDKLELAKSNKDKGVALFKINENKDAAFRFIKALKLVCSIPIDVEMATADVDGISIEEVNKLKSNLYNNLASYYLKKKDWLTVIDLCKKVFSYDKENLKASYKIGFAYMKDRNFEEAEKAFKFVLAHEDNKAAVAHLKYVKEEIKTANNLVNMLIKRMFN